MSELDEEEGITDTELPFVQPPDEAVPMFPTTDEGTNTIFETDGGSARNMGWHLTATSVTAGGDGDSANSNFETKESFATAPDGSSAVVRLQRAGRDSVNSMPLVLPNIGDTFERNSGIATEGEDRRSSSISKLYRIPPPPPEKLRQWEESKAVGEQLRSKAKLSRK